MFKSVRLALQVRPPTVTPCVTAVPVKPNKARKSLKLAEAMSPRPLLTTLEGSTKLLLDGVLHQMVASLSAAKINATQRRTVKYVVMSRPLRLISGLWHENTGGRWRFQKDVPCLPAVLYLLREFRISKRGHRWMAVAPPLQNYFDAVSFLAR